MLQREYEMAVREAEADKILTADEKKRVAELRTKMQEAMSDEDRWRERGIDSADKKATGGARSAVGAWSAATLSAILGGDHKPEEETAKNTKELVRIMRAEAERKTLRW